MNTDAAPPSGECLEPGCTTPAPDSGYCPPHYAVHHPAPSDTGPSDEAVLVCSVCGRTDDDIRGWCEHCTCTYSDGSLAGCPAHGHTPTSRPDADGDVEGLAALAEDILDAMEALGIEDASMADARVIADNITTHVADLVAAAEGRGARRVIGLVEAVLADQFWIPSQYEEDALVYADQIRAAIARATGGGDTNG